MPLNIWRFLPARLHQVRLPRPISEKTKVSGVILLMRRGPGDTSPPPARYRAVEVPAGFCRRRPWIAPAFLQAGRFGRVEFLRVSPGL